MLQCGFLLTLIDSELKFCNFFSALALRVELLSDLDLYYYTSLFI